MQPGICRPPWATDKFDSSVCLQKFSAAPKLRHNSPQSGGRCGRGILYIFRSFVCGTTEQSIGGVVGLLRRDVNVVFHYGDATHQEPASRAGTGKAGMQHHRGHECRRADLADRSSSRSMDVAGWRISIHASRRRRACYRGRYRGRGRPVYAQGRLSRLMWGEAIGLSRAL